MALRAGMLKELLISVDDWEVRGAVLEGRALVELSIERRESPGSAGNIYLGTVQEILPGMEAAFVDIGQERNGFLVFREKGVWEEGGWAPVEVLRRGQRIVVQVSKEPIGTKGAQLTTHVTLPGHFLVLLPHAPGVVTFSRRLPEEEKERLKALLEPRDPSSAGLIVRTAAADADEDSLSKELSSLEQLWEQIRKKAEKGVGNLLYEETPLDLRLARDVFCLDFVRCWVDSQESYEALKAYVERVSPQLAGRLEMYAEETPLFEKHRVEEAIATALERRVWLRSGGFLVIDETEALTSVDVNTGKYVGRTNLEDTALKTNLEACEEIARQLRLRNIGGIIVVDFIDMRVLEHRHQVYEAFTSALSRDRAKNQVVEISRLGLVEMTRKKVAESLRDLVFEPCPSCGGSGRTLSRETASIRARREIRRLCERRPAEAFLVRLNPGASADISPGGPFTDAATGKRVYLRPDPALAPGKVELLREGPEEDLARLTLG